MKPAPLRVPEVLDETGELVWRVAAPWMGVLWLAVLPLRLVQAEFASQLLALGSESSRYGRFLHALAAVAAGAFVLATLGRAVFARACLLAIRNDRCPGREALGVGLTSFLTHLYLSLLAEVLCFALWYTLVAVPVAVTLQALAAGVAPLAERPGLAAPLRLVAASSARVGTLLGLQVVFAVAFVIALLNVGLAFHAGLWLAGAAPGIDLAAWAHRLAPTSPRFVLLVVAGALLAVEPFWLAAHVVYVHRLRARDSGEDLRAWFERLRAAEAA